MTDFVEFVKSRQPQHMYMSVSAFKQLQKVIKIERIVADRKRIHLRDLAPLMRMSVGATRRLVYSCDMTLNKRINYSDPYDRWVIAD